MATNPLQLLVSATEQASTPHNVTAEMKASSNQNTNNVVNAASEKPVEPQQPPTRNVGKKHKATTPLAEVITTSTSTGSATAESTSAPMTSTATTVASPKRRRKAARTKKSSAESSATHSGSPVSAAVMDSLTMATSAPHGALSTIQTTTPNTSRALALPILPPFHASTASSYAYPAAVSAAVIDGLTMATSAPHGAVSTIQTTAPNISRALALPTLPPFHASTASSYAYPANASASASASGSASASASGSAGSVARMDNQFIPGCIIPITPNYNVRVTQDYNYQERTRKISVSLSSSFPKNFNYKMLLKISVTYLVSCRIADGSPKNYHLKFLQTFSPNIDIANNSKSSNVVMPDGVFATMTEMDGTSSTIKVPNLQGQLQRIQSVDNSIEKNIIRHDTFTITCPPGWIINLIQGSIEHVVQDLSIPNNCPTQIIEHRVDFPNHANDATAEPFPPKHSVLLHPSANVLAFWLPRFMATLSKQIQEDEESQIKNFQEFYDRVSPVVNDRNNHIERTYLSTFLHNQVAEKVTGNTILHHVIEKNNFYLAAYLINIGVSFERKNTFGETAKSMLVGKKQPENSRLIRDFYSCYSVIIYKEFMTNPTNDQQVISHLRNMYSSCQMLAYGTTSIYSIEKVFNPDEEVLYNLISRRELEDCYWILTFHSNNLLISNNFCHKAYTLTANIKAFARILDSFDKNMINEALSFNAQSTVWQYNLLFSEPPVNFKALWISVVESSNLNEILTKLGSLGSLPKHEMPVDFIPYLRQVLQRIDSLCEQKRGLCIPLIKEPSQAQNFKPHPTNSLNPDFKSLQDDLKKIDLELRKGIKDLKTAQGITNELSKLKENIEHALQLSEKKKGHDELSQIAFNLCNFIVKNKLNFTCIATAYSILKQLVIKYNLNFKFIFDFLYPLRDNYVFVDNKLVKKSIYCLNMNSLLMAALDCALLNSMLSCRTISLEDPEIKAFLELRGNYVFLIHIFVDDFNRKLKLLSSLSSGPTTTTTVATTSSVVARPELTPAASAASTNRVASASASASSSTTLASTSTPALALSLASAASAPTPALGSASTSAPAPAAHNAGAMLFKWKHEVIKRNIRELVESTKQKHALVI